MNVEQIRHHLAYSKWASRRLLDAVEAMPSEEQQKDVGVAHKSVTGTLDHIFFGDLVWLNRIKGTDDTKMSWRDVQDGWDAWAANVTADELLKEIEYKDLRGAPRYSPVWQMVLHVVNHATLHRGQVMSLLRQSGIAPPQIDLITYYRENNVK